MVKYDDTYDTITACMHLSYFKPAVLAWDGMMMTVKADSSQTRVREG